MQTGGNAGQCFGRLTVKQLSDMLVCYRSIEPGVEVEVTIADI